MRAVRPAPHAIFPLPPAPAAVKSVLLAVLALFSVAVQAQVVEAELSAASDTLRSGEYKYVVEVPAAAGQQIEVRMGTVAFDPYVIVVSPSGEQDENDDCVPGDRQRACLTVRADVDGVYRVIATSYAVGETGAFVLSVRVDGEAVGSR